MIKIEKADLLKSIEIVIGDGVAIGEEVDITSRKILEKVWPVIQYLKDQIPNEIKLCERCTEEMAIENGLCQDCIELTEEVGEQD